MKVFLDTNVLIYQHDWTAPTKQETAIGIAQSRHQLVVSTQVLIEYFNNLSCKYGYTLVDATRAITDIEYDCVNTDRRMVERAARTAADHQLSIFDALILEAAATAGCEELWTEDLNAGATLRGVRIVNPFAEIRSKPAAD